MRHTTSSILSLLALSATSIALAAPGSGASSSLEFGPGSFEPETLVTHPDLRLNVNDLTSLIEKTVPDAIRSHAEEMNATADPATFLGDGQWLAQFEMDDDRIVNERTVSPWLKYHDDGSFTVKAVCVKEAYVDTEDMKGRLFGTNYADNISVSSDVINASPDGDGLDIAVNLDGFQASANVPVYMAYTCLWYDIEVETDEDGYVPADHDEWNITGNGFDWTLQGDFNLEMTGVDGTASALLNTDSGAFEFESLEDIVLDFDQVELQDMDLAFGGLMIGSGTITGETDLEELQAVLDLVQIAASSVVPDVELNRFDGMTLSDKFDAELSEQINDSRDVQSKVNEVVSEALAKVMEFPLDIDSDHANLVGDVSLANVDIASSSASSDPEIETTWEIDAELTFDAHSCTSGLVPPSGFSGSSSPQTDSMLDAVLDYGFIEESAYILAKRGDFCRTSTYSDGSTSMAVNLVPAGSISVVQSSTNPDAIELRLPMAITGEGTTVLGDVLLDATATLALTGEFDIGCDQELLLDITEIETQDFAGEMTIDFMGTDLVIPAPDVSEEIDAELQPLTVTDYWWERGSRWVFEDCMMKEEIIIERKEDPCDLCDIQITEGMLAVPGLNKSVYIEDIVHESDAMAIGLGLDSSDICAEPSSGSSDFEDCLPVELEFDRDFIREFDADRYLAHDMAILGAELEARYDIRDTMSFIEDLLASQSNGPIFDTGEELYRFMDEVRSVYRYTDVTGGMGMEDAAGMEMMATEMLEHTQKRVEVKHMMRDYR